MAEFDESVLPSDYRYELQRTSLQYGRVLAVACIVIVGYMFINDCFIMDVGRLAYTRMVAVIPAVLYWLVSGRLLKQKRRYIIPAHIALLSSIMVSSGLFSVGLFQKGLPGSAYGAAGTMQATVLAMFVFSNGVRKYLWAVIFVPLLCTLGGILFFCEPTRVEMTLFYTPFITGICVVAAVTSQARMAARSFRMTRQIAHQKDALEEKAEALQLANNELQQFASAVAHDLKVPLHTMVKTLELVCPRFDKANDDSRDAAEKVGFVISTANRMMRMIHSMLSYASLENSTEAFSSVPLNEVVGVARLNLKQSIEESGATISVDSLPSVWGDRIQLTMLIQELMANAIKYRKPEVAPVIQVNAEVVDDEVRLSVRDNGVGFDPRHKREVFLPYRRLKTKTGHDGSGVGLASCAKIVKLHGGVITVTPVVGEGCTFRLSLPATPRAS